MPRGLKNLNCTNNPIANLDFLVDLSHLVCDQNLITQLDNLPLSLKYLSCSFTLVNSLNNLPVQLVSLDCSYNSIHYLDQVKNLNSLTYLNISNNFIELLELPNSLTYLKCSNNFIKSLELPDSIFYVKITDNPLMSRPKTINKYFYFIHYSHDYYLYPEPNKYFSFNDELILSFHGFVFGKAVRNMLIFLFFILPFFVVFYPIFLGIKPNT